MQPTQVDTIIHGVDLVCDRTIEHDAWVRFQGDKVLASGTSLTWQHATDTVDCHVIDGSGHFLTPGFIDMHMHGGGGFSNEDGAEAIVSALAAHRAHGTTRAVISLVSAPLSQLIERLSTVADLSRTHPGVLGSHLEGPFLAPSRRGAHDPTALITPDHLSTAALLEATDGTLKQITIAPEIVGGIEAIQRFVGAGAVVAIGHTETDYAGALEAFNAGASILTHAFNAMPGLHHREPGPVGAALQAPSVVLEVINDGVHVHPAMVELLFRQAHDRIALVTDAMAAACAHDGDYLLGSLGVEVREGVARLAEGGAIAGSTLTLDAALRRSVQESNVTLPGAVYALTQLPAAALGHEHEFGSLRCGFAADAVMLDRDLNVVRVWQDGQEAT